MRLLKELLNKAICWIFKDRRPRIHRYIKEKRIETLMFYFLVIYFVLGIIGGCVYWLIDYLKVGTIMSLTKQQEPIKNFWNFSYFSFIVQSTIGFGELVPQGIMKVFVVIHAVVALVLFSLGCGVIMFKFLLPNPFLLEFDERLIYYPKAGRFKFRVFNFSYESMLFTKVKSLIRFSPPKDLSKNKYNRKIILMKTDEIAEIPADKPFLIPTKKIKQPELFKDTKAKSILEDKLVHLQPTYFRFLKRIGVDINDITIKIFLQTSTLSQTFSIYKEYKFNKIECGHFGYMEPNQTQKITALGPYQEDGNILSDESIPLEGRIMANTYYKPTPETCRKCDFYVKGKEQKQCIFNKS